MSAEATRFEQARANENALNDRQREVLDLLVRGRTNGEIAAELGMTLDGAKWNVSEILGKLGLDSREQAADYWRWRSRKHAPALRGLLGVSALKWAGGIAAVGVVGAVLFALLGRGDEPPEQGLPSFYIEARFEVEDASRSIGTQPAGSSTETVHREGTVRWWQKDVDHARIELQTEIPADDAATDVIAMDGDNQFYYRALSNTYTKSPLYDFPPELKIRVRPWSMSSFIGPWAADAGSLDELLRQLKGDDRFVVKVVGTERLLGRETTVVEFSPVSASSTQSWSADGQDSSSSSTSGVSRIWVDEDHLVILKHQVEDDAQAFTFEVTKLEWHPSGIDKRIQFEPPAGAELVESDSRAVVDGDSYSTQSSMPSGGSGQLGFETPPGMLRFPSPPEGLRSIAVEEQHSNKRAESQKITYEQVGDPARTLVLDQRLYAGTFDLGSVAGRDATVHDRAAKLASENDEVSLTWQQGEYVVRLSAAGFSEDELLAFAESLEVVP